MIIGGISGVLEFFMSFLMTYLFIKTDYNTVSFKTIIDKKIISQNKTAGNM